MVPGQDGCVPGAIAFPARWRERGHFCPTRMMSVLTTVRRYGNVIRMDEILTIRVPKGMRRKLEAAARARHLTLSQYVREALATEQFLDAFEAARADLVPQARRLGIYDDEDVFRLIS
jgi:hypothetical protein